MSVAAAVLAAGASRRLGRAKQAETIAGRALLGRTAAACLAAGCSPVWAILGSGADRLRALVPDGVAVVVNDAWEEGIGSSVRAAVTAARDVPDPPEALLLAVCDQPWFDEAVVRRLLAAWGRGGASAVAARYAGVLGVPAIFGRERWEELAALAGDRGAREILRRRPGRVRAVPWPAGARDLDRPEDAETPD